MVIRNGIKQSFRAPVRMLAVLLIATLLCSFLTIGINLWQTAKENNSLMVEEFDVAAFASCQGNVDDNGNLTLDTDGRYRTVFASDFDAALFENAAGTEDVLIHRQFAGYLKSDTYLKRLRDYAEADDIFIFTVLREPSQKVDWTAATQNTPIAYIRLDWSASGYHTIPLRETKEDPWNKGKWVGFKLYNYIDSGAINNWEKAGMLDDPLWIRDEDGNLTLDLLLEAGKQYIACGKWLISASGGNYQFLQSAEFQVDQAHSVNVMRYQFGDWQLVSSGDRYTVSYPSIMPYTEDFWGTDIGQYFLDAIEITKVNAGSMPVVSTPDLSLYRPFYEEGVYISDGRTFSEEDYVSGNKVCLVSKYMADLNNWEIGDKLELAFYPCKYSYSSKAYTSQTALYEPIRERIDAHTGETELYIEEIFFDEGLYEIVGFYDGNVAKRDINGSIDYTKAEGIDRCTVIVPEKSVQNLPEVPLSQYNTTILLDDEQILYFMADMEASGLLEQQLGQYQVSFEIFDQGLGQIKQSLRQLDTVSKLTLYLACAAAVAVVILLSVLTIIQNRRQIATLRSLGVRKHQIPAAVLSGVLLVCLLGSCLGGYIGYKASDKVAGYILETAQQDMADTSFSAMLAGDTEAKEEAYTIAIQSRPQAAIFAAAAVILSLTVLSCTLALIETRKSPMLTLGARE